MIFKKLFLLLSVLLLSNFSYAEIIIGNSGEGVVTYTTLPGVIYGCKYTALSDGYLTSVSVKTHLAGYNIMVAAYSNSPDGSAPYQLLANESTNVSTATDAWVTGVFDSGIYIAAGTSYWLCFQGNSPGVQYWSENSGGNYTYNTNNYGTWPEYYGAVATSGTRKISIYGSSGEVPTFTPSVTSTITPTVTPTATISPTVTVTPTITEIIPGLLYYNDFSGSSPPDGWTNHIGNGDFNFYTESGLGKIYSGGSYTGTYADSIYNSGNAYECYSYTFQINNFHRYNSTAIEQLRWFVRYNSPTDAICLYYRMFPFDDTDYLKVNIQAINSGGQDTGEYIVQNQVNLFEPGNVITTIVFNDENQRPNIEVYVNSVLVTKWRCLSGSGEHMVHGSFGPGIHCNEDEAWITFDYFNVNNGVDEFPTATPSEIVTATITPTENIYTETQTFTPTVTITNSCTATPTPTDTPENTATAAATITNTATYTNTATAIPTNTPTPEYKIDMNIKGHIRILILNE